jgi:hypothetical protein
MSQTITMISPSDRPVRNINEALGDSIVFESLEAMQAEVERLGYMPEDGLQEGRDYEFASEEDVDLLVYAKVPAVYMFPQTGSVDTLEGWKATCADEEEEFNESDFVEVCSMNPPSLNGVSLSDCYPDGWMEISRISDVMDTELRERVHDESHWLHKEGYGWMSDQAFLTRYARLHYEKFGEDFAPIEG